METAATGGGGGGATPLQTPRQQLGGQPYMQLAMYLAGNALTVIVGLLIWNLNSVLADFRDSMLYALLCSVALRPVKDWLVQHMDASLADQRRSIAGALLSLAALPLTALVDAWEEGRAVLAKWRQAVQEEFQRRQQALLKRGAAEAAAAAAAAAAAPTSPRTPRTTAAAAAATSAAAATASKTNAAALQTMPSLAVYGHAAVKVLKSRRTSKKRRKQRQLLLKRGPEGSSLLFRWLFRICAAWLLWEWVRDSWSATVQLVLLVFTALLALGLVPLLLMTTNRFMGGSMFSPVKTPTASTMQGTGEGHKRRGHLHSVSPPKRPSFTPFSDARQRRAAAAAARMGSSGAPEEATPAAFPTLGGGKGGGEWWEWCLEGWQASKAACAGILSSLEAGLRSALRSNLHALVSALLIMGLFIGTTGLAAFLSVRVAQEGRATVLAVRDVFPVAWSGMAASTPLLAEAVAGAPEPQPAARNGSSSVGGSRGEPPPLSPAVLPAWVASYQHEALQLVQQALPAVATWAEAQLHGFVEKQNLTAALGDIRLLYETIQGPRWCSEREREKLVVALARAEVALQAARSSKQQTGLQLGQQRAYLRAAVAQLEEARHSAPAPALEQRPVGCAPPGEHAPGECAQEGAAAAPPLDKQVLALKEAVVASDAALKDAKIQHKAAARQLDGAEREQRAAASRLTLCATERQGGQQSSLLPGLAGEVAAGLQAAYAKLWRRQFREGLAEMRQAALHCLDALRGIAQRGSDAVADLSSLQRLAQAAADPLIAVGRVAGRLFAGSVGSTTAAALMGGLGVLRLGMGVVKFGMQLMLFLALLYYLLAAQADPLLAAVGVLPLSETGRQRAAVALNRALGGVLVSSMKLIAFHGCFSWITFRVMGLPLTYTASVASAVCALLPFVPTYAVALPGCVVLLAQGRLLAAVLFFALHFGGYYFADTAILEDIPGGHPYLLSLGILGGIYAFENPLQGCLLGPILLSLLSVFYNLHSEFMGASSGAGAAPDGRPVHRLWSITPLTPHRQHDEQQGASPAAGAAVKRPGLGAGLRVSVPDRQGLAEGGAEFSPERHGGSGGSDAAAVSPLLQRQHSRRSVSLSLPVAAGDGVAARPVSADEEQRGQEEEEEQGADTDGGDSGSVGNSFSFFANAAASKQHDD